MNHRLFFSAKSLFVVTAATVAITGGGTFAAVFAGSVPAVFAQDQSPAQPSAGGARRGRMGKLLMELNLSDAQKTQIRAIIADARKQNRDVTDRETKRANMKAAYAKVETVLTPDQRTQFHAKLAALRQQNPSPRPQ